MYLKLKFKLVKTDKNTNIDQYYKKILIYLFYIFSQSFIYIINPKP